MGSGVARQCSRNRCLAWWTVWIPHHGRGGAAGRANSKKDLLTGLIRVLCPSGFGAKAPASRLLTKYSIALSSADVRLDGDRVSSHPDDGDPGHTPRTYICC
jgi:hypothetical protein